MTAHPRMAGTVAVAAAPRMIWGTSLVLMLTFIFLCQGGFTFGSSDSEKVLCCPLFAFCARLLATLPFSSLLVAHKFSRAAFKLLGECSGAVRALHLHVDSMAGTPHGPPLPASSAGSNGSESTSKRFVDKSLVTFSCK